MAKKTQIQSQTKVFQAESNERFLRVDALRGVAIVWMTIFHFCFDLNYFGYLKQNFYEDSFWTLQRMCIVSLFLFCAGTGQAIASEREVTWAHFFSRWKQVFGASILVSVGSYLVYPNSFIYFGILHGIAAMLIILKFAKPVAKYFLFLGLSVIAISFVTETIHNQIPALEIFNGRALNWLGFINRKPITEDYVPLIPWLGVLLVGYSLGEWILQNKRQWFSGELKSNFRWLAVLGQWSLSYYLIHQPVLFGLVMLSKKITG